MTVPGDIARLVETFDRNIESYRQGRYNETQLRREFIDPLFKAPDHCFRIGGPRKFLLEAKKPAVNIKGDEGPAYRLRRTDHNHIVSLVKGILQLHEALASVTTPGEKNALQRQIEATDRQIDALVYELYGLSDDEIQIVE